MSKEQELKEMLKLYSKQDLWNVIEEKVARIHDLRSEIKLLDNQIEFLENQIKEIKGIK